jgi:large subunit ribosomal protein L25
MFTINAEARKEQGKGASRRLRAANKFPAIIYGGEAAPVAIELDHDKLWNLQNNAEFYSEVLTIVVDGKEEKLRLRLYSVTRSSQSWLTSTSFALNRRQVFVTKERLLTEPFFYRFAASRTTVSFPVAVITSLFTLSESVIPLTCATFQALSVLSK